MYGIGERMGENIVGNLFLLFYIVCCCFYEFEINIEWFLIDMFFK